MSGHSKWNNIKHKKEKSDAAKANIFTKIGKEMAVAIKAGGPDKVPEAMKEFNALPFSYAEASKASKGLNAENARDVVRLKREWRDNMRKHYQKAAELAAEGR